jgi:large subunit ribosomal protein L15
MRLNTIKPAEGAKQARKRVGRGIGSGTGKTAGRGHKGQKSRTGGKIRIGFEGGQMPIQRRLPKRGFRSAMAKNIAEIRLHELNLIEGDVADLAALRSAGLINANHLRAKVVLSGELDKAITLRGVGATKGAQEAILAAGGKVEES